MLPRWVLISGVLALGFTREVQADKPPRSALVLAGNASLNFSPNPFPSYHAAIFFGGSVPRVSLRPNNWLAIGVDGGLTVGFADGSVRNSLDWRGLVGVRAHVGVHGVAGARGRLMYAAGFGPVILLADAEREMFTSKPSLPPGRGIEAEGRVGIVFGRRNDARIQGVFGGQLRVSGLFTHYPRSPQPMPQFGLFLGFHRAPSAPSDASAPSPTDPPRNGIGLLATGVFVLASSAAFAIGTAIDAQSQDGCFNCPLVALTVGPIATLAGGAMIVVGSTRHHRWRRWRSQTAVLQTRGPGLRIDF